MGVSVDSTKALTALRMLDTGLVGVGRTWVRLSDRIAESTGLLGKFTAGTEGSTVALRKMGGQIIVLVAGFVALAKVVYESIKAYSEFENQLYKISALTGTTGQDLKNLSDEMLDFADGSIYTANEISNATTELTKMGVASADAVGVLAKTSAVAVGTQEDLVRTTTVAMKTLRGFGGEIESIGHVTDVMATAVASSGLTVQSFGAGMQYMASQGDAVGLTIEEVSSQLAYLANQGQNTNRSGRLMTTMWAEMADEGSDFNRIMKLNGVELNTVSDRMAWLQ